MITLTQEEALEVLYALEDAVSCGDFIETYKNIKAKIMQSEKEWIGLNPKEIADLTMYCQGENPAFFALEVEAKLKEKNGG
jgi:hypothetical protein